MSVAPKLTVAAEPSEFPRQGLDLAEYVPSEILPLKDPQTDIPRIAKDERLIALIGEAARRIPTFHRLNLGDARNMASLMPESVHLVLTSPPVLDAEGVSRF